MQKKQPFHFSDVAEHQQDLRPPAQYVQEAYSEERGVRGAWRSFHYTKDVSSFIFAETIYCTVYR